MSGVLGGLIDAVLRAALDRRPPGADLAAAARRFVDRCDGVNDDDPATNGERWLLDRVLEGRPHPVVFDVGANIGDWSAAVLRASAEARLHCFEPSAVTFDELEARLTGRACLNRVALGARSGDADLLTFPETPALNSLHRRVGLEPGWGIASQAQREQVRVETLDAYCARVEITAIDLLKLDVEGAELDVLRGSDELLSRAAIDVVQLEYGGCNIDARVLLADIFPVFEEHGYRLARLMPSSLRLYPRYDQRVEDFRHANWVALAPRLEVDRFVAAR